MTIEIEEQQGVCIIKVTGDLDAQTSDEFWQQFQTIAKDRSGPLVLDLAHVPFVDSAGLSVLVRCFKHCRSEGRPLVLAALQPAVHRAFAITRLDRAFDLAPTAVDAVAMARKPTT